MRYLIIFLGLIGFVSLSPVEISLEGPAESLRDDAYKYCTTGQVSKVFSQINVCDPYMRYPRHLLNNEVWIYQLGQSSSLQLFFVIATGSNMILILKILNQYVAYNLTINTLLDDSPKIIYDFVGFIVINKDESDLHKMIPDQFCFKGCKPDWLGVLSRRHMPFLDAFQDGYDRQSPAGIIKRMGPIYKNEYYIGEYLLYSPKDQDGQTILHDIHNIHNGIVFVPVTDGRMIVQLIIKEGIEVPKCLHGPSCKYHDLLNLNFRSCFKEVIVGIQTSKGYYTGPRWVEDISIDRNITSLYELLKEMTKRLIRSFDDIVKDTDDGHLPPEYAEPFGVKLFKYSRNRQSAGLTDVCVDMPEVSLGEPEGEVMPVVPIKGENGICD